MCAGNRLTDVRVIDKVMEGEVLMTMLAVGAWSSRPLFWDAPDPSEWDELLEPERREEPVRWATPGVTGLGNSAGLGLVSEVVPVSPVVARLQAAVRELRAQELGAQPGAQALADARAVLLAGLDLRLAGLDRLADVDRRALHDLDGATSTSSWVARLDLDLPRGDVVLTRRLERIPQVRAALGSGQITLGAARVLQTAMAKVSRFLDRPNGLVDGQPQEAVLQAVIVDGVRQLALQAVGGMPDLVGPDGERQHDPRVVSFVDELQTVADGAGSGKERLERGLLVLARQVPAVALPGAVGLLMDALLPQQLQDRGDRAHRDRCLLLTRNLDGSGWHLRGDLDLLAGERLFVLLHSEAARDDRNPDDTIAAQQLRAQGLDPHDPAHEGCLGPPPAGIHRRPVRGDVGDREAGPTVADPPGDLHSTAASLSDCAVPRSRRQRMHDAFSNLLGRSLDHGLAGTAGKATAHLQVTVGLDTLHGGACPLSRRAVQGCR